MVTGIKATFFAKLIKLAVLVALVTACGVDEAESLSMAREYYQQRDFKAASIGHSVVG